VRSVSSLGQQVSHNGEKKSHIMVEVPTDIPSIQGDLQSNFMEPRTQERLYLHVSSSRRNDGFLRL
jgi:hypothetical protein